MLVRFRVNPAQIRVGVRHRADGNWTVTLTHRLEYVPDLCEGDASWWKIVATHSVAVCAVNQALREAEAREWKGLDLDMQWSYDHPQHPGETGSLLDPRLRSD